MKLRLTLTALVFTVLTHVIWAGPAAVPRATFTQPDGTSFTVRIAGDEWMKLKTTEDGCAIVKDADGWWCYGVYDTEGRISSTGCHIGRPAPQEILSASRDIPHGVLSRKAMSRRSTVISKAPAKLEAIRKRAAATRAGGSRTSHRGLALLVEFSDTKFQYKRTDFENLLNQEGYNGTGSAKDYYEDQFGEDWEFTFDVSDIITLSYPSEHYGRNGSDGNDSRVEEMVAEACRKADGTIDFSRYDLDNDGFVDNVYLFYAGHSEAENTEDEDLIWPHLYYIYSGTAGIDLKLDGKQIDMYACSSELTDIRSLTGIGSFCHEFGHSFGLADLYDTDYDEEGGWAAGTWNSTSLMDGGSYNNNSATPPNFNCIEREMLEISPVTVLEKGKTYTMPPIQNSSTIYRLDTDTEGEYYLFECRNNEGWDKYIGGKGMLAYHVDRNYTITYEGERYDAWYWNSVNAVQSHQCADLIEADGRSDSIGSMEDFDNIAGIFFPRRNVTSLGTEGAPELKFWSGRSSDLVLTGIQYSEDGITFSVLDESQAYDVPGVANMQFTTFPDAVILSFESSDPAASGVNATVQWRINGTANKFSDAETVYCGNGKYACKIERLKGNTSYEILAGFRKGEVTGPTYRQPVQTKRTPAVEWPYIYITDSCVLRETGLPLHAVNATDAAEIEWTYDGQVISPDKDFFFRPDKSGTLKAAVKWKDGSTDTIIKTLTIVTE